MKDENQQSSLANPWLILVILGLLVVVIAFMATPVILKANKNAPMTRATSNAKQVFYLLIEFDQDYGQFPGDATAILHQGKNGKHDLDLRSFKGQYSNDYLGQFIAAGYMKSEEIFVTPLKKSRVAQLLLDKDSHKAKVGGGKTLFQTGADSVWGEEGFYEKNLVHPKPQP